MAAVTVDSTDAREVAHPNMEVVEATAASAGDTYDCKKLGQAKAVFFANQGSDSKEIRGAISTVSATTGQQRITIYPETATDKFFMVIFGVK